MYSAWDLGSGKEAGRTVRCRSFGTGNRVDTADHWGLVSCFRLGARRYQLPSGDALRSEEHTSELQSLMRISYAVFCLKTKHIDIIYKQYQLHIHYTQQKYIYF